MLEPKNVNAFCVFIYLFGPQIVLAYSPKNIAMQVDPESFDPSLAVFGLSCLCMLSKMTFEHAHHVLITVTNQNNAKGKMIFFSRLTIWEIQSIMAVYAWLWGRLTAEAAGTGDTCLCFAGN